MQNGSEEKSCYNYAKAVFMVMTNDLFLYIIIKFMTSINQNFS